MMIRIARLAVAGQRAIGKRRMLRVIEHHLILRRAMQRGAADPTGAAFSLVGK